MCSPPRRIGGGNDPSRSRRQIVVLLSPVISSTSGSLTIRPPPEGGTAERRWLTPGFRLWVWFLIRSPPCSCSSPRVLCQPSNPWSLIRRGSSPGACCRNRTYRGGPGTRSRIHPPGVALNRDRSRIHPPAVAHPPDLGLPPAAQQGRGSWQRPRASAASRASCGPVLLWGDICAGPHVRSGGHTSHQGSGQHPGLSGQPHCRGGFATGGWRGRLRQRSRVPTPGVSSAIPPRRPRQERE